MQPTGKSKIRNDIQGLRALAVLSVVFNHAFPGLVPGGFVGVDIFFVISGFLIPRIIVHEIETGRFSIAAFYRRRARRILPALLVVLTVTLVAGWFLLSPIAYKELGRTTVSTMLFASNFDFAHLTGYFDGAAELKPLLHMWSLAVEEQYYILFPPLLYLVWRRLGPGKAQILLWGLALAALVVAEMGRIHDPLPSYFLLHTRAVELMVGTLFGIGGVPLLRRQGVADAVSLLGLGMMLLAIALYSKTTPFPGATSLLPCVGAGLLIHAGANHETLAGRALSLRPLVYVGAISYSLYLWHWPLLAFARTWSEYDLPLAYGAAGVVAAFGLATLSYRYVERPFLAPWGANLPYLRMAAASIAVMVTVAGGVYVSQGVPMRFSPAARQMFAATWNFNPRRATCHYDSAAANIIYAQTCRFGDQAAAPDTVVWGDSHGAEMVVALGEAAGREGRSVREITSSACPPSSGFATLARPHCARNNEALLAAMLRDPALRTVVMVTNSVAYADKPALERGLRLSAQQLQKAGKRVIMLKQTPILPFEIANRAGILVQHDRDISRLGIARARALAQAARYDAFVDELHRELGVDIYDPKAFLCDSELCHAVAGKKEILYFNSEHLTLVGARRALSELASDLYRNNQK